MLRFLYLYVILLFVLSGHTALGQSKILETGINSIDSIFQNLPLNANESGSALETIKKDISKFNTTIQVKVYSNIGNHYLESEINDSARVYFSKGLEKAKECEEKYFTSLCLMNLARIHAVFAEFDEAIELLNEAATYTIQSDSADLIANIYRVYGNTYWGMEIYDSALDNYFKSLEIAKKHNLKHNISSATNNIGNIYFAHKDYENARLYYTLAFDISKEYDHKWVTAVSSNNLGNLLSDIALFDSALYYYRISKIVSQELGGRLHEGITVFNIGETYLKLDSLNIAKKYLLESYEIAKETNDKIGKASCYISLGEAEFKLGNMKEAKAYLDKGLLSARKIESFELQRQALILKTEYFKYNSNLDSIVVCLQNHLIIQDSLSVIKNNDEISKLKYKYKEKEDALEIENLKRDKQTTRTITFISSGSSLIILILLSLFLIFSRKRNNELSKKNTLVEKHKSLLEQTNNELISSQNKLEKMIYGKDKFITIMSHDLRNPVGAVRGFVELMLNDYDSFDDKKKVLFLQEIFKSVENISLLIDNVLYWIKSQNQGIISHPEAIDLHVKIAENISLYNIMANWKNIKITNSIQEDHIISADPNILNTIIRNLLSNSLKFTNEEGSISFNSFKDDECVVLEMEDNGKGISEKELKKIMSFNDDHSTAGTSNEQGTGLGINLVREFSKIMGADFTIDSKVGVGTKFTLRFHTTEK